MKRMRMPSVISAQAHFSQVPRAEIQRSQFDRSHAYKTTLFAGYVVPIFVDEALPGDTFNLHLRAFARLATPLKPLMDNLWLDTFFFAVPNRLVWENWQRFCGEQSNPGDSTDYVIPQVTSGGDGFDLGSIFDYFGLPVGINIGSVSALFPRAYALIWNEWFRDENLQTRIAAGDYKGDANQADTEFLTQRRGKRHDYFTSCLPWPQKGEAVVLPLGDTAPVIPTGDSTTFRQVGGDQVGVMQTAAAGATSGLQAATTVGANFAANVEVNFLTSGLEADLASATAATINALRQAFQVQRLLERDARGGTRYTEIVKAHFGVTSPDARLQRPEYLGGGSTPIVISPIAQNSAGDTQPTPQGNLAGIGTAVISGGNGFVKSFTEHCIVMGLIAIRSEQTYQQGIDRMFSRETRYDFYWPALAHIGEQAVLNKEIWVNGDPEDDDVFGYQERYAEYRYKPSKVTSLFRSDSASGFDVWHLAQDFSSRPTLSGTFIREDPPLDRVLAVPGEAHVLFDGWFDFKCARPMPVYSVPGLIDHF